jgi:hypothetical protein
VVSGVAARVKDRLIYCKKNAKIDIPTCAADLTVRAWVPFMIPLRASDPRMLSYLLPFCHPNWERAQQIIS